MHMHVHGHACACLSQAKVRGSATVDPLRLSPVSDAASVPALPHPSLAARSKPRPAAKPAARKLPAAAAAVVKEEDSDDDDGAAAAMAEEESEEEEESLATRRARAPPAAKRAKPQAASRPTAPAAKPALAKPAPSKPASATLPRPTLGKPSPPLRPQAAPGAGPSVQPLGGRNGRVPGMLNQVANQVPARSGGAKPPPAEGGGAGRGLGGGDGGGGGGGGSWSASPVRPSTPPLQASMGHGGAAQGEAAPQLLLHASMDLQLELLRSLHVRRSHIGAWLKQPSWLPSGPRGLLVKVKANMGHNSTEYVVAEIVQACADGRLELKAPSGALNQTPGEPCSSSPPSTCRTASSRSSPSSTRVPWRTGSPR